MEPTETELEQEFEQAEDNHYRYDVLDLTKPEGDPERELNGLSPADFVSRYEDTDTLDPDEESAIWNLRPMETTQVDGTSMEVTRVE